MRTLDEQLESFRKTCEAKNAETIIKQAFEKDNNYTKHPKRGILTKPHEIDGTKFKLVVWYNYDKYNRPFSIIEKQNNKNRKYHDSIDFMPTKGFNGEIEYTTRHDLAFEKLFNHLTYYSSKIDKALMFVNDWGNNQQLTIINWHNDMNRTKFVNPLFIEKNGHIFYNGLSCAPLRIDELK